MRGRLIYAAVLVWSVALVVITFWLLHADGVPAISREDQDYIDELGAAYGGDAARK